MKLSKEDFRKKLALIMGLIMALSVITGCGRRGESSAKKDDFEGMYEEYLEEEEELSAAYLGPTEADYALWRANDAEEETGVSVIAEEEPQEEEETVTEKMPEEEEEAVTVPQDEPELVTDVTPSGPNEEWIYDGVQTLPLIVCTKSSEQYAEDGTKVSSLNYDTVSVDDDYVAKCPGIAKALNTYSRSAELDAKGAVADMRDIYEEMLENGSTIYGPFESESRIVVKRNDTSVVSLAEEWYTYTGGVHGSYGTDGMTYDTKTGRLLELPEVVTDVEAFVSLVVDQVEKARKDELFVDDLMQYIYDQIEESQLTWLLDRDGIEVIFNPYEIASYASGKIVARINYFDEPDIFQRAYLSVTEEKMQFLETSEVYGLDLAGDGVMDSVSVQYYERNYDTKEGNGIAIVVNDNRYIYRENNRDFKTVYLHTAGGDWLYIDFWVLAGVRELRVFKLTPDGAEFVGKADRLGFDDIFYKNDEVLKGVCISSPSRMRLESRYDVLGTTFERAWYYVGEDGMPKRCGDYFSLYRSDISVTLLKDVSGDIVVIGNDPEIEVGYGTGYVKKDLYDRTPVLQVAVKTDIPAGTVLWPYGTDARTYVDMKDENGDLYRFTYDEGRFRYTMYGYDIEELFSGLSFAG